MATATVLAPKEDFVNPRLPMGGFLGRLGGSGGDTDGGRGGFNMLQDLAPMGISVFPTPNLSSSLAILKSRTMREEVVEHFKKSWGPQAGSWIMSVSAEAGKDDVLSLTAESRDPKLSAEVANFSLEHLQVVMARRTAARREREQQYYLSRLDQARKDYQVAQDDLIAFQEKHRTLALDPGTKSVVAAGAVAAGSVIGLELQREMKRMYVTENHPEMIALNKQIYESKRALSHQLYGDAQPLPPERPGAPPRREFFVASAKMAPLYFKMVEFYREFKTKESLYNFVAQNVVTARYNKDVMPAPVDWLDPAVPPGAPTKPNIGYNVTAAAVGGLIVGIFLALLFDYVESVRVVEKARAYSAPARRSLARPVELASETPGVGNGDGVSSPPPVSEQRAESVVRPRPIRR